MSDSATWGPFTVVGPPVRGSGVVCASPWILRVHDTVVDPRRPLTKFLKGSGPPIIRYEGVDRSSSSAVETEESLRRSVGAAAGRTPSDARPTATARGLDRPGFARPDRQLPANKPS